MRVRRGLFRLWIVASVLWAVGAVLFIGHDASDFEPLLLKWPTLVFPPILALIVGWVVLKVSEWVGRGFRE